METKYSKTLWQILRILWQERQKTLNSKGLLGSWGSGGRDSNPSRLRRDDRPIVPFMDVSLYGQTADYPAVLSVLPPEYISFLPHEPFYIIRVCSFQLFLPD